MKKLNNSLFVKVDQNSLITEDKNKVPVLQEDVKTLQLQKTTEGYKLYQLNRKEPKTFIQNIKTKQTVKQVMEDITYNKIFVKSVNVEKITGKKEFKITQSNYVLNRTSHQLVCLIQVIDTRRQIIDSFVGFSKKFNSQQPTKQELNASRKQCIKMSIGKFISVYGEVAKSGDLDTIILQERYQYYN